MVFVAALAACSPAGSTATPGDSTEPGVELPSGAASAAASAVSQAALGALDRVDSAIAANDTDTALSADDIASLRALTASVRVAVQTGNTAAAQAAIDELSAKVSTMSGDAGKQLTDAVAALKTALATS